MTNLLELVMIVKNSGEVLRKCLQSVKPYISRWTILDTGSVDHTPDIIKEEMDGVPGNLFHEPFVDFFVTSTSAKLTHQNTSTFKWRVSMHILGKLRCAYRALPELAAP